ncbi:MAG: DUF115 domain-containing protein [Acidobacteria bacterium]|nr:MAG: DUF115 domain-containing protein [Acidobacteriota bacterium]
MGIGEPVEGHLDARELLLDVAREAAVAAGFPRIVGPDVQCERQVGCRVSDLPEPARHLPHRRVAVERLHRAVDLVGERELRTSRRRVASDALIAAPLEGPAVELAGMAAQLPREAVRHQQKRAPDDLAARSRRKGQGGSDGRPDRCQQKKRPPGRSGRAVTVGRGRVHGRGSGGGGIVARGGPGRACRWHGACSGLRGRSLTGRGGRAVSMARSPGTAPSATADAIFAANREVLEARHPGLWERILDAARSGGRPDPDTGAGPAEIPAGLETAEEILVFGAAGGAALDRALARAAPEARVTLVVVDPAGFAEALRREPCAGRLSDPRLTIAGGGLAEIRRKLPEGGRRLAVLVEAGTLARTPRELEPLAAMARELAAVQRSWETQCGTILANVARNLDAVLGAPPVARLRRFVAGRPVILVAPGPSLEGQLGLLAREVPRRAAALVALDTSVPALQAAGVPVDLAVTLDGTEGGRRKILRCRSLPPLVFFEGARPEALDRCEGALYACERGGLLDRADELFGREGRYDSHGSVLLAALDVLLANGAGPIFLAGADLALTGGRAHAGGGAAEGEMSVPGKDGRPVPTTESLWRHRRRLLRRAAGVPQGRIVDVTAAGATLPGLPRAALEDVLAALPRRGGGHLPLHERALAVAERGAGHDAAEAERARRAALRALEEARAGLAPAGRAGHEGAS